jgi:hypothetical protein
LTIALRHARFNDTLAELHRNPSLCRLLDSRAADQVPHDRNLSRFLEGRTMLHRPQPKGA